MQLLEQKKIFNAIFDEVTTFKCSDDTNSICLAKFLRLEYSDTLITQTGDGLGNGTYLFFIYNS